MSGTRLHGILETAGERVELDCWSGWLADVLEEGTAGELTAATSGPVDVRVTIEDTTTAFDTSGWEPIARVVHGGASAMWSSRTPARRDWTFWSAPPTPPWMCTPVGGRRHPSGVRQSCCDRERLLLREVLLQYPALWWAGRRGCAPLHASVCTMTAGHATTALIAGPGGVGKSTLVQAELAAGGRSTCDNLCTSDGNRAWGVVEPLRVEIDRSSAPGPVGRRMPHGRRETRWRSRVPELAPDVVVVLRRGTGDSPSVHAIDPDQAARVLVTGTYMAGELRRYWQFAATLALGTGVGRAHPPVEEVSRELCSRLPCRELVLGRTRRERCSVVFDTTGTLEVAE